MLKEHQKAYLTNNTVIPLLDTYLERSRMEAQKGNLPSGIEESILTSFAEKGISGVKFDLRSLRGAGPEELRKLSAQIVNVASEGITGIKSVMRISNLMKAVPNLMQSPEGQLVVASQMKILAESANVPFQVDSEILEANDGQIPKNYGTLSTKMTAERQKEILSRLSDRFDDPAKPERDQDIKTPFGSRKVLGTYDSLPDASTVKGKKFFDPDKNHAVISNGKSYVKYNG